jgi:hypothetical protein
MKKIINKKNILFSLTFIILSVILFASNSTSAVGSDPIAPIENTTNQFTQWGKKLISIFIASPLAIYALYFIVIDIFKLIRKTADKNVIQDLIIKVIILLVSAGIIGYFLQSA